MAEVSWRQFLTPLGRVGAVITADMRDANWVVGGPQGAAVCLGASNAPP
jgi:hypothetical protein